MKIGILIYTYNRIDDAVINMDIIKYHWNKSILLNDAIIAHSYNGNREWYKNKYLETKLIRSRNSWHYQGAADLIDSGMKYLSKRKDIDYVIVLAADTWLMDADYIESIILEMRQNNLFVATCAWGNSQRNELSDVGMATDFIIVDNKWAAKYKLFPLKYKSFYNKYNELFTYKNSHTINVEKLMFTRYIQAINRYDLNSIGSRNRIYNHIHIMKEREPIHINNKWERQMYWRDIGILTHHSPYDKRKILYDNNIKYGSGIYKLLNSDDLSYYNKGITVMEDNCN